MSCRDYELLIDDAVDGTLAEPSRQALEAHVAQCAACRQMLHDFRAIRAASTRLEQAVPPAHVWTKIAAAVGSDPLSRSVSWGLTPWLAAAAAIVLLAGAGFMAWRGLTPAPAPPPQIAVELTDPDPDPQPIAIELKLAEDQYVEAISGLEAITRTSSTELDPDTADVLEANLIVIDEAIGESRAALQVEPDSEVAQDSLFEALRNKVTLLQDAVALINEMRKGNEAGAARIVSGLNQ